MRLAIIGASTLFLTSASAFAAIGRIKSNANSIRMNIQQSTNVRQTVDTSFGAKLAQGLKAKSGKATKKKATPQRSSARRTRANAASKSTGTPERKGVVINQYPVGPKGVIINQYPVAPKGVVINQYPTSVGQGARLLRAASATVVTMASRHAPTPRVGQCGEPRNEVN